MDPVETIKAFYDDQRSLGNERHRAARLTAAFRALSLAQSHDLANFCITLYDTDTTQDHMYPCRLLGELTNFVSGALTEIYPQLIARRIFWPCWLYRDADAATRNLLIELTESGDEDLLSNLLCSLAWIGDEVVQTMFHRWKNTHNVWSRAFDLQPGEYATQAGWELTEVGGRRNLCSSKSYELVPVDVVAGNAQTGPVNVLLPHDGRCGWCGRSLVTLYDLDLRDPCFDFIKLTGDRLRVVTCNYCVTYYPPIIADFDLSGGSHWSEDNGARPDDFVGDSEYDPLPHASLALGGSRKTPFETLGRYRQYGLSQIGGYPEWVQSASFPLCVHCHRRMRFIGQIEPYDIVGAAEGMIYAFICITCNRVVTSYQQT